MRPPRGVWAFMVLMASCEQTKSAGRFVSTTSFHFSTGSSSNGTGGAPMPALLNSTSRRPYFSFTLANIARIASTSLTSVGTMKASPFPSFATASSGSLRRPTSVTAKPSFISASAAARPTPVPAPVTIATLAIFFSRLLLNGPVRAALIGGNVPSLGRARNGLAASSEQPRLVADEDALEREHALLCLGAAGCREAAELAARRQHAMAWDDE